MRALLFDLRFELSGNRVRLVHGSPRKATNTCFEDKPAHAFERIAARNSRCIGLSGTHRARGPVRHSSAINADERGHTRGRTGSPRSLYYRGSRVISGGGGI
jgi:hypothetical protein